MALYCSSCSGMYTDFTVKLISVSKYKENMEKLFYTNLHLTGDDLPCNAMVQESNIGDKMPEIDTDVCTETEKNEPLLTVILDTSRGSGLKYENICRIILQKHFKANFLTERERSMFCCHQPPVSIRD